MATITGFTSQLLGGGARPNQFKVELAFPTSAPDNNAGKSAEFLCKAASLPGSTIGDIAVAYRGREIHLAGERTFESWNITIISDIDFLLRNAFERWHNSMVQYAATNGTLEPRDYLVDLSVHQLDRNDTILKSYKFFDAYPSSIASIDLGFDSNAAIEEFTVTFEYSYFTPTDI
jgi:hypothetical protein